MTEQIRRGKFAGLSAVTWSSICKMSPSRTRRALKRYIKKIGRELTLNDVEDFILEQKNKREETFKKQVEDYLSAALPFDPSGLY